MVKSRTPKPDRMRIRVYDATREPLTDFPITHRITDGDHNLVRQVDSKSPQLSVADLNVRGNYQDHCTVFVTAPGYALQGFFPVTISESHVAIVDVMLLPLKPQFHFYDWDTLTTDSPKLAALLSVGEATNSGKKRYEDLITKNQELAACMMNIATAADQILLTEGTTLDLIRQIDWSAANARDRFFAWCKPALLDEIRLAAQKGRFAEEKGSGIFHPGATSSYKQKDFGEANVQFTFHENKTTKIAGETVLQVELDIDYFDDPFAHALMEVAVNHVTGQITDPKQVYVLRWIAGRQSGRPEFSPPYSIVKAD